MNLFPGIPAGDFYLSFSIREARFGLETMPKLPKPPLNIDIFSSLIHTYENI